MDLLKKALGIDTIMITCGKTGLVKCAVVNDVTAVNDAAKLVIAAFAMARIVCANTPYANIYISA